MWKRRGLHLISDIIKESLDGMDVSVLMGANLANEVAQEQFSEATIGTYNQDKWKHFFPWSFHSEYFRIRVIKDVHGVELCGALKNVGLLLPASLMDSEWVKILKAAIIRIVWMKCVASAKSTMKPSRITLSLNPAGLPISSQLVTVEGIVVLPRQKSKLENDRSPRSWNAQWTETSRPPTAVEIYNYLSAHNLQSK